MQYIRVFVVILVNFFYLTSAIIRPSFELSITNGQGFVAYLEVGTNFGNISHCWFNFQDLDRLEIDLNSSELITTERGEQVRPFSKRICGIRVDNVSLASIGSWKLQAENNHEEFTEGVIKVNILAAPKMRFETKVTKPLGKNTISCTKQEYTRYCKLINPISGDTWNQCDLYTTVHNGSSFECHTMSWGNMDESIETINVESAPATQYSVASIEETDEHYVLRCDIKSTSLHTCRAEMPDRKTQLYIMDGLSNGRYTSYDTVSSQSKCALEIPKPLEQNEMGLWKIQHSDASQLTGCLFYVGSQSKDAIIEDELKRQQKQYGVSVDADESTSSSTDSPNKDQQSTTTTLHRRIELYTTESTISEITCTVPFVVDDCYLRDPKNNVHFPESVKFERSRALGICTFINVQSVPGIWSCGLRGSDYKNDVVQDIEVAMESKLGRVLTDHIKVAQRDSLELMCKSPFDEPISKCVYVDPTNQVHLVASTTGGVKMTGHVQYSGDGIEKGFCGMRVNDVDVDDFGDWSCQFLVYNNGGTVSNFTITVTESVLSYASSIHGGLGYALAAGVVVVLIASFVGFRKRKGQRTMDLSSTETGDMSIRE